MMLDASRVGIGVSAPIPSCDEELADDAVAFARRRRQPAPLPRSVTSTISV
jgi:hypothetical protein